MSSEIFLQAYQMSCMYLCAQKLFEQTVESTMSSGCVLFLKLHFHLRQCCLLWISEVLWKSNYQKEQIAVTWTSASGHFSFWGNLLNRLVCTNFVLVSVLVGPELGFISDGCEGDFFTCQAYLLSGLRFSTAVWVWLVVRMETCSPSGPLVVEMTSYSEERTTKPSPDQQRHGI